MEIQSTLNAGLKGFQKTAKKPTQAANRILSPYLMFMSRARR